MSQINPSFPTSPNQFYLSLPRVNNGNSISFFQFVVQSLSHVWLFVTPRTEHASLPCPSPSPGVCFKLMSIELVMPSNHPSSVVPFSSCLQSFPALGSFLVSWLFTSGDQSFGVSALASVLPINIQDWFPLGLTGLISLQSKGLSRVFFSITVWRHNSLVLSLLYGPSLTSVHNYWKNHTFY